MSGKTDVRAPSMNILAHLCYVLLAMGLLAWVCYDSFFVQLVTYGRGSDVWEHLAVLKSWSENISAPVHAHIYGEQSSPRYTPLYLIYASLLKFSTLTVLEMYGLIAIFQTALFLVGFWWFCKSYFKTSIAPVIALIVILCFWGQGWGWSNAYDLRAFLLVIGYPSMGVFGLSLILFAWTLRFLEDCASKPLWEKLSYTGLISVVILSHPLTALFCLVGCAGFVLIDAWENKKANIALSALILAGIALSFLWPWYPVWGSIVGNDLFTKVNPIEFLDKVGLNYAANVHDYPRTKYFYKMEELWSRGGTALLGVPALLFIAFVKKYRWLSLVSVTMVLPFLLNMLFPVPLGHRFAFFFLFIGHLAVVAALLVILEYSHKRNKTFLIATGVAVSCILIFSLVQKVDYVFDIYARKIGNDPWLTQKHSPHIHRYENLASHLTDHSVILADTATSFGLPAFKGKVIHIPKAAYYVSERRKRQKSVKLFFSDQASFEERQAIVKYFDITHIIIPSEDFHEGLKTFCHSTAEIILVHDDVICEIKKPESQSSTNFAPDE